MVEGNVNDHFNNTTFMIKSPVFVDIERLATFTVVVVVDIDKMIRNSKLVSWLILTNESALKFINLCGRIFV